MFVIFIEWQFIVEKDNQGIVTVGILILKGMVELTDENIGKINNNIRGGI
jgi:hypothetical protein